MAGPRVAGSWPASSSSPPPPLAAAASPLESLPAEMLDMIVGNLFRDMIVPRSDSRQLAKTRWLRSRTALRSLCLTSRSLSKHGQSILYRHVAVADGHEMALFLGAILSNPSLGLSVRGFECSADADAACTSNFPLRTTEAGILDFRHYRPLESLADLLDSDYQLPDVKPVHMPYLLFMDCLIALLWVMPNLERVCIPLPAQRVVFHHSRARAAFRSLLYSDRLVPLLQNVTYVQLRPHGAADQDFLDLSQYGPVLASMPSLEKVELIGDDGNFEEFMIKGSGVNYSENISHLILSQSGCTPCDIADACNRLTNLQTLSVTTDADLATYGVFPLLEIHHAAPGSHFHDNCLNNGLPRLKNTLTNLHLQFNYHVPVTPLIGPGGKVTCLPSLTSLRVLSIGILQLYTSSEIISRDAPRSKLAHLLPGSLTELRLHIDAGLQSRRDKSWYSVFLEILGDFARDVRPGLPHLSVVVALLSNPYHEMYHAELATLATAFVQQGVLLTHQPSQ
ncbi:glyoxalase-like domain-containing protein [Purpureocillium lavendulum]|uniref:Glyoxalase-like domain-containing protein n=1 Tax=Purpureocillium lavendulum TaxID=1247861 RepID=A0AB34FX80_9HYPO|nr:glyoxalase-like domain-containing protein [Purpureocillium lavendulum]